MPEALDNLAQQDIQMDTCRLRGFPFGAEVKEFVEKHEVIFVIEQNRDAQMRTLLINELEINPAKLVSVIYYAGLSISADFIRDSVADYYEQNKLPRLSEVQS